MSQAPTEVRVLVGDDPPIPRKLLEVSRQIAKYAASVVALCGLGVLSGWILGIARLKSLFPGLPEMAPLTALMFLIAGAALWCAALGNAVGIPAAKTAARNVTMIGVARVCATVVLFLGFLRLAAYFMGWNFRLDLLGFAATANAAPSRTSPATALGFVLLGCGLLLACTSRFPRTFQLVVMLGSLVGWLGFSHYLYGGEPLLPYARMAIHTAISLLILSAGILSIRPQLGLAALLSSESAGGMIARRLVPFALVVPIALGWLRLQGQRAGWFGTEAGVSLFALANVVIFGGLIWKNAALLDRSDLEKARAQKKVLSQLERLNLLQTVTSAIGGRLDLSSIYQVVLQCVEENLNLDLACICDYDATLAELAVAQAGQRTRALTVELGLTERARVAIDSNGLSRCVQGKLIYEPEIAETQKPFTQKLAGAGLHSLVLAPLQLESKVFGVFIAARRKPSSFTSDDCEFLRQLSEHVALAAQQAQLYATLQQAYNDLRETQQAVMQQERLRALGQMASGVAHDINNALSPVMLCTEALLETEKALSAKGQDKLKIIQRAISDAAQTVARMREFYRKREGELALWPMDMNSLMQQSMEITRARWSDMAQRQGIVLDVRTEMAKELPAVLGVESEIREALINLIFNAVDAMPNGGTLTLRTLETGEAQKRNGEATPRVVSLEVSDTGVGMDEETRLRCTEPFFTTKGERGTGLGLAMVYGTARRHGADVEIESSVGKGTTVRLRFAAQIGRSPEATQVEPPPAPSGPLRILVVDDDPVIVKSLQETLQYDGHYVFAAVGGEAGIEAFRTAREVDEPFAVVMTDLGMPYVDGRKVAMAVKSASPSTPVILLTGWGQRLVAEGEVPPHVDHVLSKPPKLLELRATLAMCSSTVLVGPGPRS